MKSYHFDDHYQEKLKLGDGTQVLLRCIRPEDKSLLVEGLGHLSERSLYQRFFTAKHNLTPNELRYLTEVDGVNHFAIGAKALDGGRAGLGVGVGRFIGMKDEPKVAEPALVVIDDMQGRGLGRHLFIRLVEAGLERGFETFHCEVLATNDGMRALLDEIAPEAECSFDGAEMVLRFQLEHALDNFHRMEAEEHGILYHLFKGAAEGNLQIGKALESLSHFCRWEDDD